MPVKEPKKLNGAPVGFRRHADGFVEAYLTETGERLRWQTACRVESRYDDTTRIIVELIAVKPAPAEDEPCS